MNNIIFLILAVWTSFALYIPFWRGSGAGIGIVFGVICFSISNYLICVGSPHLIVLIYSVLFVRHLGSFFARFFSFISSALYIIRNLAYSLSSNGFFLSFFPITPDLGTIFNWLMFIIFWGLIILGVLSFLSVWNSSYTLNQPINPNLINDVPDWYIIFLFFSWLGAFGPTSDQYQNMINIFVSNELHSTLILWILFFLTLSVIVVYYLIPFLFSIDGEEVVLFPWWLCGIFFFFIAFANTDGQILIDFYEIIMHGIESERNFSSILIQVSSFYFELYSPVLESGLNEVDNLIYPIYMELNFLCYLTMYSLERRIYIPLIISVDNLIGADYFMSIYFLYYGLESLTILMIVLISLLIWLILNNRL